jgi:hypothetical protein
MFQAEFDRYLAPRFHATAKGVRELRRPWRWSIP